MWHIVAINHLPTHFLCYVSFFEIENKYFFDSDSIRCSDYISETSYQHMSIFIIKLFICNQY